MKHVIVLAIVMTSAVAHATPPQPAAIDPSQMIEAYQRMQEQDNAQNAAIQGGINSAQAWTSLGVGLVTSAHEFTDSYAALSNTDANCVDLSPAGAPAVPAACANQGGNCGQCYTDAVKELNGMRLNLERLHCYFTAYERFVNASLAFGDSASGIHAVTGLEWQTQRGGIVEAQHGLEHTYDTKLQQMLPNLQHALQHIGQCESQYFNTPDWYDRFGFIYYSFMADRYKR